MASPAASNGDLPSRTPDFLIIGAQKAGTTSLHAYLGQVAGIFLTEPKEPGFFCSPGGGALPAWNDPHLAYRYRYQVFDAEAYARLFAEAGDRLCGEATTMYLNDPDAPARAVRANPQLKVIAVLREPAARAFSSWMMWRRVGLEARGFAEAIAAAPADLAAGCGPGVAYVDTGRYAVHLDRWRALLGDERVHLVASTELEADPAGVVAGVLAFLGLGGADLADVDFTQQNRGDSAPRSYRLRELERTSGAVAALRRRLPAPLRRMAAAALHRVNEVKPEVADPQVMAAIRAELLDDTERLERLTGWDLSGWKP